MTGAPAPNVLLITIDTLRADAVGAYGNRSVVDAVDRPAGRRRRPLHPGARLDGRHAAVARQHPLRPLPVPSRRARERRLPVSRRTSTRSRRCCRPRHYRTGAFVSAFPLDARFGLTRGFDVYDDRFPKNEAHRRVSRARAARRPTRSPRRSTGSGATSPARRGRDGAPWFAWVHLYEPHFPYAPPEPFASRYRGAPYLGEVAAADAALGPLLQPILDAPGGRDTLVVLTADHGESLGEHGEMTHGLFAYEATLRVPLILYPPRLLAARAVAEPVRHVDILPTILDAIGAPLPAGARRPQPAAARRPARRRRRRPPTSSRSRRRSTADGRRSTASSRGSLKYIDLPIPELYDLAADPAESHDLDGVAAGRRRASCSGCSPGCAPTIATRRAGARERRDARAAAQPRLSRRRRAGQGRTTPRPTIRSG